MLLEVRLNDEDYIYIDAEPAIGIDKGGTSDRPPPQEALNGMLALAAQFSSRLVELTRGESAPDDLTVSYGVRVDSNGMVSVAKNINEAQIQITARWNKK